MQLPAPMHLWRSTRARMAISATPTAASPRNASEVASARLDVPSRASSRARRCGHLVLGRARARSAISAFVRPSVRSCSSRRSRLVEARARRAPSAPESPRPGAVHRAGQLDELAPDGPGQPADADRLVGGALGDPRQRQLEVAAHERLHLGRRRRRSMARAAGMTISRLTSSWRPAWSAWSAAPPAIGRGRRCRRGRGRPSASAASACAPHGAWPGRSGSSSFTCVADRSTSSTSAASGASPAPRSGRRAAPPRGRGGPGPRSAPTPGRSRSPASTACSRCRRMPSASPAAARPCRARSRAGGRASATGPCDGRRRGQAEPPLGPVDVAELEEAQRDAAGGEELDRPVALEPGRPMGILAAGQREVRHRPWPARTRGRRTASGARGAPARSR